MAVRAKTDDSPGDAVRDSTGAVVAYMVNLMNPVGRGQQ